MPALLLTALSGTAGNGQRSLGTPRHLAAKAAGLKALHLCSGYFSAEAPRVLTDATLADVAPDAAASQFPTEVDEKSRRVRVRFSGDLPPREAVYRAGMGCTLLPIGAVETLATHLLPTAMVHPDLDARPWPLGDVGALVRPRADRRRALGRLIDEAFRDGEGSFGGKTWGILVLQNGRIVAERYQHGFGSHIAARTNSMCKSLGGTLIGVGVRKGLLDLQRPAPLAEWRTPGDPRGTITLDNLLHMSSGLYTDGAQDPQVEIYQSGAAIAEVAARNIVDARPGSRFVYAGTDTNLAMRGLRQAYANDAEYAGFPYRELLWKIGMTRTTIETDWNNDFIVSGQCWSTARDFARLGLLYLADGVWAGERLLPEGWSRYVAASAPAQPEKPGIGGDAGYGGQFWLFGGMDGLPSDTFAAFGAQGQYAVLVPSRNMVVIRRGFDQKSAFAIQRFTAEVVSALSGANEETSKAAAKRQRTRH